MCLRQIKQQLMQLNWRWTRRVVPLFLSKKLVVGGKRGMRLSLLPAGRVSRLHAQKRPRRLLRGVVNFPHVNDPVWAELGPAVILIYRSNYVFFCMSLRQTNQLKLFHQRKMQGIHNKLAFADYQKLGQLLLLGFWTRYWFARPLWTFRYL